MMTDSTPFECADERHLDSQDRRVWLRTDSEFSHLQVRTGDHLMTECLILDESVGGVALEVEDEGLFELGREIEVIYASVPMKATVRSCVAWTDGTYRVGLQWRD